MITLLFKIALFASTHVLVGFLFYMIRKKNPAGLMRWDVVAFGFPLLAGICTYFLLLYSHKAPIPLAFPWSVLIVLIGSVILGVVFQIVAMTIGANIYGS